jgi:hypothetical protein
MTKTRFDIRTVRRPLGSELTSDSTFLLAALTVRFAMLTLFAVLLLADVVGLARILPLFALPAVLFVVSGVLEWRWAAGEAEAAAVRDVADRSSPRTQGSGDCCSRDHARGDRRGSRGRERSRSSIATCWRPGRPQRAPSPVC